MLRVKKAREAPGAAEAAFDGDGLDFHIGFFEESFGAREAATDEFVAQGETGDGLEAGLQRTDGHGGVADRCADGERLREVAQDAAHGDQRCVCPRKRSFLAGQGGFPVTISYDIYCVMLKIC